MVARGPPSTSDGEVHKGCLQVRYALVPKELPPLPLKLLSLPTFVGRRSTFCCHLSSTPLIRVCSLFNCSQTARAKQSVYISWSNPPKSRNSCLSALDISARLSIRDKVAAEIMTTSQEDSSISLENDFRRAIAKFEASAKLTESEQQECRQMTLQKLQVRMASLQHQQARTRQLLFMKRLEPFIETISAYGQAIDVFANTSEVLAFIWVRLLNRYRTPSC